MPFVQREEDRIVGAYARPQTFASEFLNEDDLEVIEFRQMQNPQSQESINSDFERRIAALEALMRE